MLAIIGAVKALLAAIFL